MEKRKTAGEKIPWATMLFEDVYLRQVSRTFLGFTFFICRINGLESKVYQAWRNHCRSLCLDGGMPEFLLKMVWNFDILRAHHYLTWREKQRSSCVCFLLSPFLGFQGQRTLWILHLLTWKVGWGVGPRLGGKMGKHKGKLPLLYVDFHAVLCAQSLMQCSQGQFSREGFAFAHHTLQSGGSLPYPDILVQIERVWTVKVQYCFGVYYNQVPER